MLEALLLTRVSSPPLEWSGPGPKRIAMGNQDYGYFGKLSDAELYTLTDMFSLTGIAADGATPWAEVSGWYKFMFEGKVLYIRAKPVAGNLSWKKLYERSLIFGTKDSGPSGAVSGGNPTPVSQMFVQQFAENGTRFTLKFRSIQSTVDFNTWPFATEGSEWEKFVNAVVNIDQGGLGLFDNKPWSDLSGVYGYGELSQAKYTDVTPFLAVYTPKYDKENTISYSGINDSTRYWRPVIELIPTNDYAFQPQQLTYETNADFFMDVPDVQDDTPWNQKFKMEFGAYKTPITEQAYKTLETAKKTISSSVEAGVRFESGLSSDFHEMIQKTNLVDYTSDVFVNGVSSVVYAKVEKQGEFHGSGELPPATAEINDDDWLKPVRYNNHGSNAAEITASLSETVKPEFLATLRKSWEVVPYPHEFSVGDWLIQVKLERYENNGTGLGLGTVVKTVKPELETKVKSAEMVLSKTTTNPQIGVVAVSVIGASISQFSITEIREIGVLDLTTIIENHKLSGFGTERLFDF